MRLLPILLVGFLLCACQGGTYHLEKENYREQVKTLGVLPLMVDRGSRIDHSQPEQVFHLLERSIAGRDAALVELLRGKKSYFDVRTITVEPRTAFSELLQVDRNAVGGVIGRYRVAPKAAASLARKAVVDGLLLVVLRGVNRVEKRYDRKGFDYLEDSYNRIEAEALVVLPDGRIAWEFPAQGGHKLIDLFFPDFDEAYHNRTDQVRQHELSLAGLERQLTAQKGKEDKLAGLLTILTTALSKPGLQLW